MSRRRNKKYSVELKLKAVQDYLNGAGSLREIVKKYEISSMWPLIEWIRSMEGYWGLLKSEMYYLKKFSTKDELTVAIENYIHFYNTKRYQLRLHSMTPMEFHAAFAA